MKITIDLAQSPIALMNELTQAVRLALGANFYIEEGEGNFTAGELVDPNVNLVNLNTSSVVPIASGASTPDTSGVNAATASSTTGGVELDSEGHPYDVRIHSAGKSKIANGTWKLKKGVDKDLVTQINAQNKSLLNTPLPTAGPTVADMPSLVADLPALTPVVAALPDLPPVAQVAAPDVEIVVSDYPTFAQYVAQQMVAKAEGTKRELDKGLAHYGFVDANGQPDLTALAHRPDAVMPLYTWLKAVLALVAA